MDRHCLVLRRLADDCRSLGGDACLRYFDAVRRTFLLQSLLVIGVAVPTPGGVGSYHAAYQWGVTTFFGAQNDQAIAGAIVTHAISFVPVVLLGLAIMAQDGLSVGRLKDIAGAARDKERPACLRLRRVAVRIPGRTFA